MVAETKIGVGGAWKGLESIQVGVGGAWKEVSEIYVGVGGAWKLAYNSFTASLSGTFNTLSDQEILTTYTSTTSVTVNISNSSTIAVTTSGSGTNPLIQKNGFGAFLSSQTCSDGDTLKARLTTGSSEAATYTCVATLGSYGSKTFIVFTE
tara:strand:+ start:60 stop:512 length:453 start_codon:yes stop_codon:yes gene_type:complete